MGKRAYAHYTYAANNPIGNKDQDGLDVTPVGDSMRELLEKMFGYANLEKNGKAYRIKKGERERAVNAMQDALRTGWNEDWHSELASFMFAALESSSDFELRFNGGTPYLKSGSTVIAPAGFQKTFPEEAAAKAGPYITYKGNLPIVIGDGKPRKVQWESTWQFSANEWMKWMMFASSLAYGNLTGPGAGAAEAGVVDTTTFNAAKGMNLTVLGPAEAVTPVEVGAAIRAATAAGRTGQAKFIVMQAGNSRIVVVGGTGDWHAALVGEGAKRLGLTGEVAKAVTEWGGIVQQRVGAEATVGGVGIKQVTPEIAEAILKALGLK